MLEKANATPFSVSENRKFPAILSIGWKFAKNEHSNLVYLAQFILHPAYFSTFLCLLSFALLQES